MKTKSTRSMNHIAFDLSRPLTLWMSGQMERWAPPTAPSTRVVSFAGLLLLA